MKVPRHFPLVCIHWRDACHIIEEIEHADLGELYDLWEVGFLIKETKDAVVIAMATDGEGTQSSRNTLTIPKVNIVEVAHVFVRSAKKAKKVAARKA